MIRISGLLCLLVWTATGAAHPPDAPDAKGCRCQANLLVNGWCSECQVGYYAGVRIESAVLFDSLDLHGHAVDPEKTRCPTCREAMASGGFCDDCQMGFIEGKGYFSHLCYAMTKGRPWDASANPPPCCPVSDGWCDRCASGRVANRVFARRDDFADAQRWFETLKAAVAKAGQCEICAAAMIANSGCFRCGVVYKDGKAAPNPTTARVPDTSNAHSGKIPDDTNPESACQRRSGAGPARSGRTEDTAQSSQ
jgi:hypothetical protein